MKYNSVLQIKRGNRDNLGIFSIFFHKNIFYDPSLELIERVLMRGHKICFHREIRKIIFELSSIPSIWSSEYVVEPR